MWSTWKEKVKTLTALMAPVIIIWLLYDGVSSYRTLHHYPAYTIGHVTLNGYALGPSPGSRIAFEYSVDSVTYKGASGGDLSNGHTRFLVKFSTEHPSVYKFYKAIPIPDSIQAAPTGGWTEPPFPVPAQVLE